MVHERHKDLEKTYLGIRDKENRIYTDDEVRQLPYGIPKAHIHYKEWKIRQLSLKKLISIIDDTQTRILDLGCGNGWMSYQLSKQNIEVVGLDINEYELEQARRVFGEENPTFVYGDVFDELGIGTFDAIVISAALQYFQDPVKLIERLYDYLNAEGIVIVMDTFIYANNEVDRARERSIKYFEEMGSPQMSQYYFHHSKEIFKPFRSKLIYLPGRISKILGKFGRVFNPFPVYIVYK